MGISIDVQDPPVTSTASEPLRPGDHRNYLLRQVDWRVLLPDPCPEAVTIVAAPHLTEAVRQIAGRVIAAESADAVGACDLAVAGDARPETLLAAARALKPEAHLYLEVDGVYALRRRPVARRLRSIGLAIVGEYMPWPVSAGTSPRAWLPVDGPGAARFFLDSSRRRAPVGIRERVRSAARELAGRGYSSAVTVIIARRRGDSEVRRWVGSRSRPERGAPAAAPLDLLSMLRAESRRISPELAQRSSLCLLTPGRRSVNKIVGFIFQEPDPVPRLVVKLPRVAESAAGLRNEEHVLRALDALDCEVPTGMPKILFSRMHGELPVIGQSFVPGRPLSASLDARTARAYAVLATEWLIRLGRCRTGSAYRRRVSPLVGSIVADFADQFGSVVDRELLRTATDLLETVGFLSVTCEQRDFSPWNLRVTEAGELAVLDWESAALDGVPLTDLIYFLSYLAFYLDGASDREAYLRSYRSVADPATFTGSIAAECIERYAEGVGLASSAIPPLRVLVWLIHARSEFRQLWRDNESRPDAAALSTSLFVKLWEAEIRSLG